MPAFTAAVTLDGHNGPPDYLVCVAASAQKARRMGPSRFREPSPARCSGCREGRPCYRRPAASVSSGTGGAGRQRPPPSPALAPPAPPDGPRRPGHRGDCVSDREFFARRLRALRRQAGLSPAALSERSGLNVYLVQRFERGDTPPSGLRPRGASARGGERDEAGVFVV